MSLDLAILDERGFPTNEVRISVDEHNRLMEKAASTHSRILLRLHDYYEDADIAPGEIDEFIRDLSDVGRASGDDPAIDRLLAELASLGNLAKSTGMGITAISD
jgi:hypothetical protein